MFNSAKKIIKLLNKEQKNSSVYFLILLIISTIFEGLSIALVFPLIKLITEENYILMINKKIDFLNLENLGSDEIIFYSIILILTTYLLKSLYLVFFSWWKSRYILKVNNYISSKLFKKYIFSPYSYFFNKNSSEFIRNIYSEARYINQSIDAYFKLFIECLSILTILIVLFLIQFKNTLILILILFPLIFLFNFLFSKNIKIWGFKKQHYVAIIFQNLQQSFGSIKEIILRGSQTFFSRQFDQTIYSLNDQTSKLMFISEIPKNILETLTLFLICIIIFITFQEIDNYINIFPIIGLFGAAALRVVPAFNRIISNKQIIDSCYPSVKLIHEELKNEIDINFEIKNKKKNIIKSFSFEKDIELKNIEYRYPASNKSVFKNLNLKIKKNDCVCFIGDSGSGKTTIADIISGLLMPINGKIILDGTEVSLYNYQWRKLVGYVTQTVYLMDDTIKNNILFGLEDDIKFDKKRFDTAIKFSQLDNLIKEIPEGVEYRVGENGIKLSGGQKQRIGIARTLYQNPEILVLDEITSSLDEETSLELLNSLNKLSGKITMIYISHNNLVMKNADIVYKIQKDEQNKISLIEIKKN